MGEKTEISWTDSTWNPIRGCSVVSRGCENCYAMTVAARFSGKNPKTGADLPYAGLAYRNSSGAHWTGKVKFVGEHLEDPLKWKQPRRIFVNSMSDLFHEGVEDQWLNDIFGIMALAHWHTFQVLTKRPQRMLKYVSQGSHGIIEQFQQIQECGGIGPRRMFRALDVKRRDSIPWEWPLPNVHLGVSVEDQKTADERIPLLLETPAAVRWVSIEPLLNDVSLRWAKWEPWKKVGINSQYDGLRRLDGIVIGGESGAGHREMPLESAINLARNAKAAGVSVFFKQDSGPRPGTQGRIPDDVWAMKEWPKSQVTASAAARSQM